jgi:nitrate/nitrite-specific signal transduction histidine kinase
MQERARQLGGRLELRSPEDGGTTLVWQVPVAGQEGHDTPDQEA